MGSRGRQGRNSPRLPPPTCRRTFTKSAGTPVWNVRATMRLIVCSVVLASLLPLAAGALAAAGPDPTCAVLSTGQGCAPTPRGDRTQSLLQKQTMRGKVAVGRPMCEYQDTWSVDWPGYTPESACSEWAESAEWGALKDYKTLDEACSTEWAQSVCKQTCCTKSAGAAPSDEEEHPNAEEEEEDPEGEEEEHPEGEEAEHPEEEEHPEGEHEEHPEEGEEEHPEGEEEEHPEAEEEHPEGEQGEQPEGGEEQHPEGEEGGHPESEEEYPPPPSEGEEEHPLPHPDGEEEHPEGEEEQPPSPPEGEEEHEEQPPPGEEGEGDEWGNEGDDNSEEDPYYYRGSAPILIKLGALCGERGDLLSSSGNPARRCGALAKGAGAKAFALGKNLRRGKCYAMKLPVDSALRDEWGVHRASPRCPAGEWKSDPNFDFFVLPK